MKTFIASATRNTPESPGRRALIGWKILPLLATFAVTVWTAGTSSAGFVISGTSEFSGTGQTFDGQIVINVVDSGANTVTVTIDATQVTGPSTIKFSDFYLNLDPSMDPTAITTLKIGGDASGPATWDSGENAFKADGDGDFDFHLSLPVSDGNNFTMGETLEYSFTGAGLDAADFNFPSVNGPPGKNGFFAATHAQGLGANGGGSGWFGNGPGPNAIPVPPSILMALTGLVPFAGAAGIRRLRRKPIA